jgi:hypothetical protein
MVLNWRSKLSNLPSAATGREEWVSRRDSVLAGAGVCISFCSLILSLAVAAEGFFVSNGFDSISPGIRVAVVVWRFWWGKDGRGPHQDRTYIRCIQAARRRIPAQPWASRIGFCPERLGAEPMRFFFLGAAGGIPAAARIGGPT